MSNFTITKVTAFVAIDPKDGDEGIMAFEGANGVMMPLVCADEARIQSMLPIAEMISGETQTAYRIVQFSIREDVTDQVKEKYLKHQS
jgi:hypothetical protein